MYDRIVSRIKLAIAALAVAAASAGCISGSTVSDGQEKRKPEDVISDPQLTVTALFSDNAGFKEDWLLLREIRDRTGVELRLIAVPDKDFGDRRDMVLSSGEAPDLILNTWPDDIASFARPDILVPIDEVMDRLPHFRKRLEETGFRQEYDDYYLMGDGKHYLLPGWGERVQSSQVLFYRADLFRQLNLQPPTTYDELALALKTLKLRYPNSDPWTNRFGENLLLGPLSRAYGTNAGWSLPNGYTYDRDRDEWVFAPTTDGYRQMTAYLRKLMADGLLDKTVFIQDGNAFNQKLTTGVSFVGYGWLGEEVYFNELGKQYVGPDYELKWLDPLAGPSGKPATKSEKRGGGGIAINAKARNSPDFDRMLRFIDWLWYSEEGQTLANWGVEGVTYTVEEGRKRFADSVKSWSNPGAPRDLRGDFGFGISQFAFAVPADYAENAVNPAYREYWDRVERMRATPLDDPGLLLNDAELERTKLLVTKLNDYTSEQLYNFVLGASDPERDWDRYVKECEMRGSKELLAIVNQAWLRMKN